MQGVSHQDLVALGSEHDLVVSLKVRPGSHTIAGTALAVLWPARQVDEDVVAGIRKAVVIGQARTPDQDAEFSVLLLEEMAVRALSQVGAATSDQRVRARLDTHVQQLVEAFALTSPQDCDAQPLDRHAEQVRRSLPRSVLGGHL